MVAADVLRRLGDEGSEDCCAAASTSLMSKEVFFCRRGERGVLRICAFFLKADFGDKGDKQSCAPGSK
jgi:hypothetical protein